MSGDVRTLDDSAFERIASGEGTMRDDRTLMRELAAEVLRLRSERDALRAAAGSYLAAVTGCAAAGELLNDAQAAYERAVDQIRAEPGNPSHRIEVAHAAVRLSAAGLAYIDVDLMRDAARERLRTLAGEG